MTFNDFEDAVLKPSPLAINGLSTDHLISHCEDMLIMGDFSEKKPVIH